MKKVILMLLLLLILNITNTCVTPTNQIPFELVNHTPILSATINGIPAKLLLDTGATITVLDASSKDLYKYYTIVDRTNVINGVGGQSRMYDITNATVVVLGDTLDIQIKGLDLTYFREQSGIVGIIGIDFIKQQNLKIDFKTNIITKQ